MALAGATKTKYVPPRKGTLHLKVIDGFIRKKNFYTLSVIDQKYAYKMAKGMGDVMMMADAVQNARTRYNEAYSMYKTMYKECGDKTAVLVKVGVASSQWKLVAPAAYVICCFFKMPIVFMMRIGYS